jgi:rare lipoprotein A
MRSLLFRNFGRHFFRNLPGTIGLANEETEDSIAMAFSGPSMFRWVVWKDSLKPLFVFASFFLAAAMWAAGGMNAQADVASIYGGADGLCGSRTANGERLDCAAMTAAHRTLSFGTFVQVCHNGCVIVRINDRGPFVRGRHIDLSPAAAHAIGLDQVGRVSLSLAR